MDGEVAGDHDDEVDDDDTWTNRSSVGGAFENGGQAKDTMIARNLGKLIEQAQNNLETGLLQTASNLGHHQMVEGTMVLPNTTNTKAPPMKRNSTLR